MKFGVVNKSTTLNRFVLHTLQRNITHLAVITRKTKKLGILKEGVTGKEPLRLIYVWNEMLSIGQLPETDLPQNRNEAEIKAFLASYGSFRTFRIK